MIGKRIAHYEVKSRLGAGGMGEVWQASDSKLGRDVALKMLPEHLVGDPERLARFQREAQVLASLNHSNIGAIYGIEEAEGARCLVLELVKGETLADRIARGPLPLDEALQIARQIADAMEMAHDKGVMHRDLKPGNVMITPDGTAKVLDFGLAKAVEGDTDQSLSMSPTITAGHTVAGVILGTAGYMSPEQAKGKPVDRRADIWAFGIVLYEMLTGYQAFSGETVSEVLAAVMMREIEWDRLPKDLPRPILDLLHRCLDKDPRRRLRDIGEARLIIDDYLANPAAYARSATEATAADTRTLVPVWLWAVLATLGVVAVLGFWSPWRTAPVPPEVMEFDVELSPDPLFSGYGSAAVLSRGGERIAFSTSGGDKLFVRELSDPVPREISHGDGNAYHLFFSPDGEWLAFFSRSELKKVSIRGGAPLTLAEVSLNRGGTWTDSDEIIYAPTPASGLLRIPAAGGTPVALTELDSLGGEISHRWPEWVPGTQTVLFTVFSTAPGLEQGRIEALDLKTGKRTLLQHGATYPHYVPTGHILYLHRGTLFAVPFDAKRTEITGTPGPIAESIRTSTSQGAGQFDVSANGTMLAMYGEGTASDVADLLLLPLDGGKEEILVEKQDVYGPSISPDGKRVAFTVGSFSLSDVWMIDLERRTRTRMTFAENTADWHPIWSPDGKWLAYSSGQSDAATPLLHVKAADGSGEPRLVAKGGALQAPESWSPDGSTLVFSQQTAGTWGLWSIPADGSSAATEILDTRAFEISPRISPDGRWLAYQSTESGQSEIYIRPFPGPGGKWQISTNGGFEPRWTRRGDALYYVTDDSLFTVPLTLRESAVEAGRPRGVKAILDGTGSIGGSWDIMPDGSAIILARPAGTEGDVAPLRRVRVTLNWFERLKKLAPVASK